MAMSDAHKDLLRKNRVELAKHMRVDEEFLSYLRKGDVLTAEMKEEIQVQLTEMDKRTKFLDIIPRRGAKAFDRLVEALKETAQMDLVYMLTPYTPDTITEAASLDAIIKLIKSGQSPAVVRVTSRDEEFRRRCYPMVKKTHGRVLVVKFGDDQSGSGVTAADGALLRELFERLSFTCDQLVIQTRQELRDALSAEAEKQTKDSEAFLLFVLSAPGYSAPLLDAGSITSVFDGLRCPALKTKPKLFFIQTAGDVQPVADVRAPVVSRGPGGPRGAGGDAGGEQGMDTVDGPNQGATPLIHEKADQYIVKFKGSERVEGRCSCIVAALVHSIASHAHFVSLPDILQQVKAVVQKYRKQQGAKDPDRQVLQEDDQLCSSFYFNP